MKKIVKNSLLTLVVLIGLSACNGSSPQVSSNVNQGEIGTLVKPIYIHIDFKNDEFTPVSLSSKFESGHTSTIIISTSGKPVLKGYRTGGTINCSKGRGNTKGVYCQNDTPFFSNTVGVRFKPYGHIILKQDNLYDFLSDHNLYSKINNYNSLNKLVSTELKKLDPYVLAQQEKYESVKPQYKVQINDKSGLYDQSIDFNDAVHYRYNKLEKANYTLPAYKINDSNAFFTTEKKKFLNTYPGIKTELYAEIDRNNKHVTMYYNQPYSEKYVYKINKIDKIYFNKKSKIIVDIQSADIKLNYPVIAISDKTISIEDGESGTIRFTNNSNDFISIKSVSYYFNKDIITDTDFDKNSILEIPPEAYVELSKDIAEEKFEKGLIFNATTAKKLKANKINFGLAIKYVKSSSNKVKTLYKTKKSDALSIVN